VKKSGAEVSVDVKERAARGSVLMEFVVVAPLYLVLLGGMFILGELMLERIRMHIGDRYVVWMGGSRFCPTKVVDGKKEVDDEWLGKSLRPLFARSIGGDAAVDFQVDRGDDDSVQINGFMSLYMGGVTNMTVSLPGWATGMMSATSASGGENDNATSAEYSERQYNVNYFRTYVFLRDEAAERLSKDVDAAEMISGRLSDAVSDRWINNSKEDEEHESIMPSEGESGGVRSVLRMLGRFAE